MATRRMFSLKIIDTDLFLDMPTSSRLLYFDLSMRADDDGFIASPKKIIKMTNANEDDLRLLIAKKFIIPFESGICVIRHWKIHNYIQKDRYSETLYFEEKNKLKTNKDNSYQVDTECIQDVSIVDTQVRLGKVRLGKVKDKEIKEKSQSLKKNNKLIKECEKWLDDFNKICNTNFKTLNILVKNYTQWRKVYTYEEMSMAIQLAHVDEWFKNKLTPQLLLRTRNKNGECDYIGELLNKCKGNYDLFNKLLLNGREKKIKFEKEQKEKAEKQREIVEKQKTKLEKIRKQKQLEEKIEREKQEKNMLPTGTFYVKKNRNIGAIDFN